MQRTHRKVELFVVIAYCIGHLLMGLFHEPWFDEALAWLIARDSSIYEILFVTPHFEGHPSLWHLILMPFAKLGLPYELSLCLVSLLFSGTAVAIYVYKSPFKRIVRFGIPFTYYIFYQYSVISRPYCMMMLAFMLMAVTYGKRNTKPGRFIMSLWFLCLTSAYGIVIAGGICITWLIEMFMAAREQSMNKNSENGEFRNTFRIFLEDYLIKSKKLFWFTGLLIYVIIILWRILPDENAYAAIRAGRALEDNGIVVRLLFTLFGSISDLFFTNVFYTSGTLRNADIYVGEFIGAVALGVFVLVLIVKYTGVKKIIRLIEFFVPYTMFAVFSALVYLYYHHIGIELLFFIYWIWIIKEKQQISVDEQKNESGITSKTLKLFKSDMINSIVTVLIALMIILPLYWSVSSCITDILESYGSGREQYEYLSENDLDTGYNILVEWNRVFKEEEVPEDYTEFDPVFSQQGVNLTPYLSKSKIINTPYIFGKNYCYQHEIPQKGKIEEAIASIKEYGIPDIIVGDIENTDDLDISYLDYNDYVPVYESKYGNIKKGLATRTASKIYVHRNLAEKLGLDTISVGMYAN